MSSIRYRGERNIVDIAKNLDAFKKVREEYTEPTKIGGTVSLISRIFIIFLIYIEVSYYLQSNLIYTFKPDVDLDDTVKLHVDLTVAMPCIGLSGVDFMDETQQDTFSYGTLQRESTHWDLSRDDRLQFEQMQHINSFLREEFHSVADIVFKDMVEKESYWDSNSLAKKAKTSTDKPFDACRLHGTFVINKVAGVLHLYSGMSQLLGFVEIHFHVNDFARVPSNFTHRINKFSFGDYSQRIIQPLEGDERYVEDESTIVQYHIQIVPTQIQNIFSTINTYQYAVTENIRVKNSEKKSVGTPGIYFKYDWSALKVIVRADRDNLIQFIIRLCSIISGIVVISGILNYILQQVYQSVFNLIIPPSSTLKPESETKLLNTPPKAKPTGVIIPNDLINNANKMATDNLLFTTIKQ